MTGAEQHTYRIHVARLSGGADRLLPSGHRTPFGWPVAALSPDGEPATLSWSPAHPLQGEQCLRLSIAFEVWEQASIEVSLRRTGTVLGLMTIDHCDVFEAVELALGPQDARRASLEGLHIRMASGREPVRIFQGTDAGDTPLPFAPQLIQAQQSASGASAIDRLLARLRSIASLQQFGWKEGCVLDGLLDLEMAVPGQGFAQAARDHLALFLDPELGLRYEDPWGRIADGAVYGIEGALPFAAIHRIWPSHPVLEKVLVYLRTVRRDDGALFDEGMVSTEGSYTVAYPLALLGSAREDRTMIDDAVTQLRIRAGELWQGDVLHLRRYIDGRRTYPNWIRAHTWHLLGLVRVLQQISPDEAPDLREEFARAAKLVMRHQRHDGLWSCFIDDPDTHVETSGSAGIAAALALGARAGLVGQEAAHAADQARAGLIAYITPDGMLSGASQANKDGERLQRLPYRINSQMGMGLMGQLIAARGVGR